MPCLQNIIQRIPRSLYWGASASMLAGCSIVTPVPTWELAKTLGAASTAALQVGPTSASGTVVHPHPAATRWCIELNRETQVSDIVPALQQELQAQGIESRVYEPGRVPAECPAQLSYAAWLRWEQPMWSSEFQPYVYAAALTLRDSAGAVLGSTRYELDGVGLGKWSSTRKKMAPLVRALLTGFDG